MSGVEIALWLRPRVTLTTHTEPRAAVTQTALSTQPRHAVGQCGSAVSLTHAVTASVAAIDGAVAVSAASNSRPPATTPRRGDRGGTVTGA